MPSPARCC